jgi:argininosuccinate lyase
VSKVLSNTHNTGSETRLFDFTHGLDVDRRLYRQEIRVQKAWVEALFGQGHILSLDETNQLLHALDVAAQLIANDTFQLRTKIFT